MVGEIYLIGIAVTVLLVIGFLPNKPSSVSRLLFFGLTGTNGITVLMMEIAWPFLIFYLILRSTIYLFDLLIKIRNKY